MRILHIIPKISSGGTEKQLEYLCTELLLAGHEVHVAYLHDSKESILFSSGVCMHKLRATNNHNPILILQIIKLIRQIAPDIVNTWILQMDIFGGLASLYCGVPFVLREPSSELAYPTTWKNRLRLIVGRYSAAIIANSNGGISYWKTHVSYHNFYKILNGIPIGNIKEVAPASFDILQNSELPLILYVGRFVSDVSGDKNLVNLLRALAIVNKKMPVNSILCGDGPQRTELEDLSKILNISDRVYFANHLSSIEVWGLMKSSSIFISLSGYEGCPNSVLEAIACECPVVLSDIPAHREILDHREAKFVNHFDIENISESILDVINNLSIAKEQAMANLSKTDEFSTKQMLYAFEEVYFRHSKIN